MEEGSANPFLQLALRGYASYRTYSHMVGPELELGLG